MPKIHPVPKHDGDASPDPQPSVTHPAPESRPSPRPERTHSGPLSWMLGGAPPARQRPGQNDAERRREPAPQRPHAAVDARRRRNPSSRFRG